MLSYRSGRMGIQLEIREYIIDELLRTNENRPGNTRRIHYDSYPENTTSCVRRFIDYLFLFKAYFDIHHSKTYRIDRHVNPNCLYPLASDRRARES